jgi:hypothetical protein
MVASPGLVARTTVLARRLQLRDRLLTILVHLPTLIVHRFWQDRIFSSKQQAAEEFLGFALTIPIPVQANRRHGSIFTSSPSKLVCPSTDHAGTIKASLP